MKILALPCDKGACGWYRVRQPLAKIKALTGHETHVIDKEADNMLEVAESLAIADVIIMRTGGEMGRDTLTSIVEAYGRETKQNLKIKAKWVMDIDDNLELISPYSEHYRDHGTNEYYDQNSEKWVWKNGQEGFDAHKNRAKAMRLMTGLIEADMVTVTTEKLAENARMYNKNVRVLPNCIDGEKWWKLPLKHDPSQLRIGWNGGISHYEDWYTIKKPLNKLLRKYKFKLVMVGSHFTGIVDQDLRHLVEVHPWVPFDAHSYRMMALNLDIAVIPLADLPFNHYKSPIKLVEMSAMGVPSVVANVLPYSIDPVGAAVPYFSNESQFEKELTRLIEDIEWRDKVAVSAYEYAHRDYSADKNVGLWIDAYASLL